MLRRARPHQHVQYRDWNSLEGCPPNGIDLIYSNITLQHMPQENQYEYIREFIRILHPDGLAVFELPDGPEYRHPEDHLSMYAVARETVEQVVEDAGGKIVDVEIPWHGSAWTQYRYAVKRA
jgi:trans-aconitate methyltransferase